ncbi:hypothetical protein [Deinococcus marmoris]|uniref:Uncharacterized protein n=1 Tax=Deinococcus marmoris TaxID=249408 RepID=A0A1U7P2X9_9DEIO|nr:hypothetical protein [Deinococcus marmoris]OLV19535.1 hypothetical protein BOO71_0002344 [Deinococcus marmoris]
MAKKQSKEEQTTLEQFIGAKKTAAERKAAPVDAAALKQFIGAPEAPQSEDKPAE